ncbi:MAG TPA: carboxypeptidase-like regulatory domain-containing protein, partial [Vicinamibacterales bacterium]|nr:carboxypeptidase-like regulatory domain-containing protein [Vicinamibacterales bacterium]
MLMHVHYRRVAIAMAAVLLPSLATAQVVEQQTIQITTSGGGSGGSVQLPMGLGGPPRQFKTGTGRLRGRVLASDGSGPIRRAQVRISGTEVAPKAALTDAEGRFEFRDLPAGRFTLTASKSGFVSVQFGQTRPYEQGKPIELTDKQALDNADINMPRGGVIAGRIVDEFGDAVPDAAVTAMRLTWMNGRRRLAPAGGRIGQTNDLGQYRIYGLPPGDYYVSASLRGGTFEMMDVELMVSGASTSAAPSASMPKSGYASTYYPGTPNAAEAQKIALAAGQETASADFSLVPVRLARISGLVLASDGKPVDGASISVTPASRGEFAGIMGPSNTRTAKDGSFTLNSVPPGDYLLQARSIQTFTSTQGDSVMVFRAGPMGSGDAEFGAIPLSVSGEDLSNVVLMTSKGATVTGHVTFDGGRPSGLAAFRIMSMPVDLDVPTPVGGPATPKEDGTFELKGLSGQRVFRLAASPPGWTLKSVKLNGNDITDSGAEFKPGEATSGLEIEVTSRTTSITGSVTASDGALLKDYTVVVFADSPELWR